jgi:hypothetical protein
MGSKVAVEKSFGYRALPSTRRVPCLKKARPAKGMGVKSADTGRSFMLECPPNDWRISCGLSSPRPYKLTLHSILGRCARDGAGGPDRPVGCMRGLGCGMGRAQLEDHDGDDDGQDPVTEGFQAFAHRCLPVLGVRRFAWADFHERSLLIEDALGCSTAGGINPLPPMSSDFPVT